MSIDQVCLDRQQMRISFSPREQAEGHPLVPPKVKDLVAELERAVFVNRRGKGSHRNFVHPSVTRPVTISGKLTDDAKHYQIRAVRLAIKELKNER